jgi:hypothetical protein
MTKQRHVQKKANSKKTEIVDLDNRSYHDRVYVPERIEMEEDGGVTICIKYPIHINRSRLALLERICETMNTHLSAYIRQALYEKIDSDLHNPTEVGQAFCDNALESWNNNNDTQDYQVLQRSILP